MADRVVVLSRRPGRVLEIVPVALGRPRTEAMLGERAFVEAVERIWALIKSQARRRCAKGWRDGAPRPATAPARWRGPSTGWRAGWGWPACWCCGSCSTRTGWVPALFLPSPLGVLADGGEMLRSGELLVPRGHQPRAHRCSASALGALAGVGVGFAVGFFAAGRGGRHPAHRRHLPHPEDRAAAAADPVAGHRRGLQGRGDRARRVLSDGDQHLLPACARPTPCCCGRR